jgi:hypothetical protein
MAIIDLNLATFGQTVKHVITGKDLLMSGEIDLTNLDGVGVDLRCVITKKNKTDTHEKEGRVESFPSVIKVKENIDLNQDDLVITQKEVFLVGEVSLLNDNQTGTVSSLEGYKRADLELYKTL